MKIKILKRTPYRRDIEREILPGEIHEIVRVRPEITCVQVKAYYVSVNGRERMFLPSDCKVIKG